MIGGNVRTNQEGYPSSHTALREGVKPANE